MKSGEAAKLLGGYATGTLSEAERQTLFAAALERQELFDALMDEEALRELLADPGAKAQLMEALSQAAPPRVVPLWRRPSLLGAAAGLIVAATAGLTYLRSPEKAPPPLRESTQPAPAAAVSAGPQAPPPAARQNALPSRRKEAARPIALETAAPPPPPPAPQPLAAPSLAGAPVPAREEASRMNLQAESRRADAQDRVAQKAEAPKAAGAMMDAAGSTAPAARMRAKTAGAYRPEAAAPHIIAPAWTLALQPDGSTRVTIGAVRGQQVALLRRGAAGVEVLPLRAMEAGEEALVRWQGDVRLAAGDILDLYLLNTPVADPAGLPETGPVDGYRVRIHPASTK